MFHDGRQVEKNAKLHFDVCVVGSGPAGITLARDLASERVKVCLLEGGGMEFDSSSQHLYEGNTEGVLDPSRKYLSTSRIRCFGGTSFHWGGFCRPMEEIDLARRSWVPASGWPLRLNELNPYYDKAARICGIPCFVGEGRDPSAYYPARDAAFHIGRNRSYVTTYFHQSYPPTRFGRSFRSELGSSKHIHVFLHSTAQFVRLASSGRRATEIPVRTSGEGSFTVAARKFVLATGGIENARLLLLSHVGQKGGIGAASTHVGKHFMDHPLFHGGWILLDGPLDEDKVYENWTQNSAVNGRIRAFLRPSDDLQERLGMLNHIIHLAPDSSSEASLSRFSTAFRRLDAFAGLQGNRPSAHSHRYKFAVRSEQSPNSASRVVLDPVERDPFGNPRVKLSWQMDESDTSTVEKTLKALATELGAVRQGRIRRMAFENERRPIGYSSHHMGTTRMSEGPETGVVNRNCQVHGISNLFLAGSSVFPTSGYCNPTFTIMALSLRLSQHLKAEAWS